MAVQAKSFPEIEGPDFIHDEGVADVARDVLNRHGRVGGPLFAVREAVDDQEISVLWLRNAKPFDPDKEEATHETVGKCIKAPGVWRDVTGYQIAIWMRGYFWDQWSPEEREAFLLHELLHVEVKRSKDGQAKVSIAKHDVEDFVAVVKAYGPVVGDSARYIRAGAVRAADPVGSGLQDVADRLGGDVTVSAAGKSRTFKGSKAPGAGEGAEA